MTEREWLECGVPQKMLAWLQRERRPSDRKLRLFAVAFCCAIWRQLPDDRCRVAVKVAERFADGLATSDELRVAEAATEEFYGDYRYRFGPAWGTTFEIAGEGAWEILIEAAARESTSKAEQIQQAILFREILGNPYRPISISPAWRTPTVVDLAHAIYAERAFDRMPILGDALEDAGCDQQDILTHCRQPSKHVPGCWVVDLILDKK